MKIKNFIPFIGIIFALILAYYLNGIVGRNFVVFFFTISSTIIRASLFIVPFLIFTIISNTFSKMKSSSIAIVLYIFLFAFISNSLSLSYGYYCTEFILNRLDILFVKINFNQKNIIESAFTLPNFPIPNEYMMLLGIFSGVSISHFNNKFFLRLKKFNELIYKKCFLFFQKIFPYLIPIYIFGFSLKMGYEKLLNLLFFDYNIIFLIDILLMFFYMFIIFGIACKLNLKKLLNYLRYVSPAFLSAITTSSSSATMPFTIQSTEKITKEKSYSRIFIALVSNLHAIGDNILTGVIVCFFLRISGLESLEVLQICKFFFLFFLAKICSVGLPGSNVFILFPVLQSMFGFNMDLLIIFAAIYSIQDPIITTFNVVANCFMSLISYNILKRTRLYNENVEK